MIDGWWERHQQRRSYWRGGEGRGPVDGEAHHANNTPTAEQQHRAGAADHPQLSFFFWW